MWLIVGLGNPGNQYARNRHNIGFMAVDVMCELHGRFGAAKNKFTAELFDGTIDNEKAVLMKPLTFMNLSGQSVGEAARFYKVAPENIVVIHDDLDLEQFKTRIKKGGGHGGHNGLKSIDAHLGSQDYWRIRIGISHPGDKADVTNHVLGNFAKADEDNLATLLACLSDNIALMISGKPDTLMTRLNEAVK